MEAAPLGKNKAVSIHSQHRFDLILPWGWLSNVDVNSQTLATGRFKSRHLPAHFPCGEDKFFVAMRVDAVHTHRNKKGIWGRRPQIPTIEDF